MSGHAPKNADGLFPYVVTKHSWGKSRSRIEWAENLTTAKREYGWTRELYTSVTVRRATNQDLDEAKEKP